MSERVWSTVYFNSRRAVCCHWQTRWSHASATASGSLSDRAVTPSHWHHDDRHYHDYYDDAQRSNIPTSGSLRGFKLYHCHLKFSDT